MSDDLFELQRRCEAAELEFSPKLESLGDPHEWQTYTIEFPAGRTTVPMNVQDGTGVWWLLERPFENYKGLERFKASWSPKDRVIECTIVYSGSQTPIYYNTSTGTKLLEVLSNLRQKLDDKAAPDPQNGIEFDSDTGLSISIRPCSDMHGVVRVEDFLWDGDNLATVVNIEDWLSRPLTLQIKGAEVTRHDDAVELLQRIGNSLLFQLDLSFGLSLLLQREHSYEDSWRLLEPKELNSWPQVKFEYDREPMALYWYGKTASDMPLLRFLACYQVMEYYFPRYSEVEAQRTLRNVLKDPTFDPNRDGDIVRLLNTIKVSSGGRAIGNEASQLKATIHHCVSPEDLSQFLVSEDEHRYEFYTSQNAKKVFNKWIPLKKEKGADFREEVANRIYAIRNRIVHTKGGYDDQEPLSPFPEPLFPFAPETKYLRHDIELVEFLARKVLIASSRPLQV